MSQKDAKTLLILEVSQFDTESYVTTAMKLFNSSEGMPKDYFSMHKTVLRITGVSLREQDCTAYKFYSYLINSFVCIYPFLGLRDLFILTEFDAFADLLTYEFAVFIAIVKTVTMLLHRKEFAKLLDKLEAGIFLPNAERGGEEEEHLIKQCVRITTYQTVVYWACACFVIMFTTVYTLIKRITSSDYHDWMFAYGSFTLFNPTRSPNYELSWFYQNFSCAWLACLFTTVDVTIAAVLCHINFQLKILQGAVRRIVELSYKKTPEGKMKYLETSSEKCVIDTSTIQWKYLKESVKETVDYHLAIIEVANEMERSFGSLLLLVLLGTLGMLCLMVYKASMIPVNDLRIVRSLIESSVVASQVLMICYWGEQIKSESCKVAQAAYSSNFVGTDLRFQKALGFIIRRSQKPITLTAAKFTEICLATFTWFIRTSYSAFMVLRSRNFKDV